MEQKFLDKEGVKVLWRQASLKDYPNNETLMAVIDAIDETKADKDELFSKSWNDLTDRPFYSEETEKWIIDKQEVTFDNSSFVSMRGLSDDFITLFNTVGSRLKVYWNGSIYECEVKYHNIAYYNYIDFADRRAYLEADVLTISNTTAELEIHTYEFGVFVPQETVKTLDEKFIPKIASSWNDLEDKPFYEETTISENIIIDTEHDFTTGALYINNLATAVDEVVKITVNENEYTATVFYVGNPIYEYGLSNFSEGCPFEYDFGHGLIDTTGTLGSVNIKITNQSTTTTIKKLDEKYLPQSIGKATDEGGEIFNYYLNESSNRNFAGHYSHAEGYSTSAGGEYSHTEGCHTAASSDYSHAEGNETTASGTGSHAEGDYTTASGASSHAEGYYTTASGAHSHTEGNKTTASGNQSHAEGDSTIASEYASHAEGYFTEASGYASHAEGECTIASGQYQHVQGKYNIYDVDSEGNALNTYAHIVGNGNSFSYSNAHTLDWSGNAWFSGDVYTGSTSGTNKDAGSKKLATEDYVATELNDYYLKSEADTLHDELHDYVDTEVAALVNAAPETLDTLGELATAFEENKEVVEALDASITNKQDKVSNTLILVDTVTGIQHKIQIQNGQLVSFPVE